jgi:hypothetical protein
MPSVTLETRRVKNQKVTRRTGIRQTASFDGKGTGCAAARDVIVVRQGQEGVSKSHGLHGTNDYNLWIDQVQEV